MRKDCLSYLKKLRLNPRGKLRNSFSDHTILCSTLSSLDRTDTQRGVLPGVEPKSAICVQRFDDSLNSAIRITYRISLRSSSLREPRHPLLRVVLYVYLTIHMK